MAYHTRMVMKEATECLSRCEAELRTLVGRAARDGQYDAVMTLTQWAQSIAVLIAESTPRPTIPLSGGGPPTPKSRRKYPIFTRTGDALIKVGWSPKSRREYEHRAPLELLRSFAVAAQQIGARGRLFQLESLAKAAHGDASTPGYQLYVVVAWWREAGLVDQHGRKGYSIPKAATFTSEVDRAFTELTPRKN